MNQTLYEQNIKFFDEFKKNAPNEIVKMIEGGWDWLKESDLNDYAIKVGQRAPTFSLKEAGGNVIDLAEELKKGPVVLTFYRGGWCPFCSIQLRAYQEVLQQAYELGASVVAITPESPSNVVDTIANNGIEIPIITDHNNVLAEQYGLKFTVPEITKKLHESVGVLLPDVNDEESWALPVPGTFIINKEGIIIWSHCEAFYVKRAEPKEIIDALISLQKQTTTNT